MATRTDATASSWAGPEVGYLQVLWAILRKDLALEMRTRELLVSTFAFALISVVVFSFAFVWRGEGVARLAAGVLWVTFAFAGTLGLNRSLVREVDQGALAGLMLAPVDRSAIYLGKMVANFLFLLGMEVAITPIFAVFTNLNLFRLELVPIFLLGTLGFAAAGTLLATLSVQTRTREVLLPLLLLPILVPVLIGATEATGAVLTGAGWGEAMAGLRWVIAFDLLSLAVGLLTFDVLLEE